MSDKTGASPNSSTPPVNLTELELTVARDPLSDACIPLLEAYLGQGRHMEAMVLGKKAVKAKPEDTARRLLLAPIISYGAKAHGHGPSYHHTKHYASSLKSG